jgi:hypothetical protein
MHKDAEADCHVEVVLEAVTRVRQQQRMLARLVR